VVGRCENSNETLGSVKGRNLFTLASKGRLCPMDFISHILVLMIGS
jgi:hypothetical protein